MFFDMIVEKKHEKDDIHQKIFDVTCDLTSFCFKKQNDLNGLSNQ